MARCTCLSYINEWQMQIVAKKWSNTPMENYLYNGVCTANYKGAHMHSVLL